MDALVGKLNDMCDQMPFQTGWHLKEIRSGKAADRMGDIVVPSASVRKIAIMMAAFRAVNRGRYSLKQRVSIEAKYQNNDSGCFQHLEPDFSISLQDAITMMIIVSDNTCTGAIADMIGLDEVNKFSRSVGMLSTAHRHGFPPIPLDPTHPVEYTNATTPNDVGLLLDLIVRGGQELRMALDLGCTVEQCQMALTILSWQKLRTKLPSLLPLGTKVAHKTGTGARNHNDAGVIFLDNEPLFILSVFTEDVPVVLTDGTPGYAAASQLIGKMSRACYDKLSLV